MDHTKPPSILSICTGMRGLERGLERVVGDITVAAYVEIEAFIIYNLVKQMEQGVVAPAPVWTDLKTFPGPSFHGKIHGIVGGYPCQPFSLAGKRGGDKDDRHLWPYIERLINAVRPVWCFFENVDDHLSLGFDTVYKSLRNMGYSVEAGIYTAQEAGAPHERARLFMLAVAHSENSKRGLQLQQRRPQQENSKSFRTSERVDNTTKQGLEKPGFIGERELSEENKGGLHNRLEQSGDKLGDTESNNKWDDWNLSGESKQPIRRPDTELADINSGRSWKNIESSELWSNMLKQSPRNSWLSRAPQNNKRGFDRWPAGQGKFQYEWEAPRAVEPGLGCTINGYNFRNDLLRMYGNGVVEQTAAIAFRDLIKRFD